MLRREAVQKSRTRAKRFAPAVGVVHLVKDALAERLRTAILTGKIRPGERIIEATWARRYGAAQASIREAIHVLTRDGFVTKVSGRSARVVSLSEEDVLQLYELRGALEGLSTRLAVARKSDTTALEQAVLSMRRAVKEGDCKHLLCADLDFHLELCRLSGNLYVIEHARRILLPLFAFVHIRIVSNGQGTSAWERDLEAHQRIVDLIQDGDQDVAELYVRRAMQRFAQTAYKNWSSNGTVSTGS